MLETCDQCGKMPLWCNCENPSPNPAKNPHVYDKPRTEWAKPHGKWCVEYRGIVIEKFVYEKDKGFIEDTIDRMLLPKYDDDEYY